MKITVDSSTLARACAAASRNVPNKTTLPITENILFQVGIEGKLQMTTTDNENWTVNNVPITIDRLEEESLMAFCINARNMTDLLQAIPSQPIAIEVKRNDYTDFYSAVVSHSAGKAELPIARAEEFPTLKPIESEGVLLPADLLKRAVQTCRFAVLGDKEVYPQLTAVCLDFKGKTLVAVATDKHKIVRLEHPDIETEPACFLLHPKCISLMMPMLDAVLDDKDSMGDVLLRKDGSKICVSSGTDAVYSIMSEGRYPNYDSVIPKSDVLDKVAVIDRRDLMAALTRSMLFANAASCSINFHFDAQGFVKMIGEDIDFSKSSEEKLDCTFSGSDSLTISLKGTTLKEMLGHLSSQQVRIEMQDSTRAIIIREEHGDENLLMLLMPMLL